MSGVPDTSLDAVIVGGGPNGLAAAITLARAGRSVRVLQRASEVGGGARSGAHTLPGFVHDTCSAIHPFGRTSPFFVEAGLERHGLRWVEPEVPLAHPLDGGRAVILRRDVDATAAQLGGDRDAYRRLVGPLDRSFGALIPDILGPFHVPLSPRGALRLARFGLHGLQPATWLCRRFRGEAARALFAGAAAHSALRLSEPVSGAAALVILGSAHHDGWPFPEGGAGRIAEALVAELRAAGGHIETDHEVTTLEDLPASRLALFDTSPRTLDRSFGALIPDILGPFHVPLSPRRALRLARFGLHGLQPATWLCRRFRGEAARALFAGAAAHSALRLSEPVSGAAALVILGSAHHDGWPFPEGGAGRIAEALIAELRAAGGHIETDHEVTTLEDLPASRLALIDTSPRTLDRVAGTRLPQGYRRKLRAFRYGPSVFKLDIAIEGSIPWQHESVGLAGTVHLGGTFEEIARSEADATAGRISPRPFVLLAQHSQFDRTRAPEGRNAIWAYCHVPHASAVDMTEVILGQIERFAPGFRERVLAIRRTSPRDLETYNPNDVGGDISGGRMDLRQLFTRPAARLDPYSTPDPRVFLCSSSTPPGGGIHGMPGWHAAHSALRRLTAS